MPDRRTFLRTLGAAALAGGLPRAISASRTAAAKLERIGLQLYTVRGEMAKDFDRTLARVAQTGYAEVEFAGYFGREPDAVKAALDQVGLAAPATHLPFQALDNWDKTLENSKRIGHQYTVIPSIPSEERRSLGSYRRVADRFNQAGAAARAAGLRFAYHNHDFEFAPIDGQRSYDVLLDYTDPSVVEFEMDLYWIIKGGGDPLAYFARYPGRFPMVHVKDGVGGENLRMVDVGQGTIDFRPIFARREEAGIKHYFVEHDEPPDPFASIKASYEYLKRLEF